MDTVAFARESLAATLPEIEPLVAGHYHEVLPYGSAPLKLQREVYSALEKHNAIILFTARLNKQLVGYCSMVCSESMHAEAGMRATEDAIYLKPEVRGFNGIAFFRWMDEELKRMGVNFVHRQTPAAHDHGVILERQGYRTLETVWQKKLNPVGVEV